MGLLSFVMHRLLIVMAFLVVDTGSRDADFRNRVCLAGSRARTLAVVHRLSCSENLFGPGIEPVSPALADSYLLSHQGSPRHLLFLPFPPT